MARLVIVLFGPPAAGKTTIAQASGLAVYDRDDPIWTGRGEAYFRQALRRLARSSDARAVVIRAGATSTARARAIADCRATQGYLVLADPRICHERAGRRSRGDVRATHAAIDAWWAAFDHDDQLPLWQGTWALPAQPVASAVKTSRAW